MTPLPRPSHPFHWRHRMTDLKKTVDDLGRIKAKIADLTERKGFSGYSF